MRILFIGDIVGRPGRSTITRKLPEIREELNVDLVIANGENASGGVGLVVHNAQALFESGIDVITSGNHIFQHKGYEELFSTYEAIIRPANYPPDVPGKGAFIRRMSNYPPVAVMNLLGRTFMEAVDCPFQIAEKVLSEIPPKVKIIIVDIHAEATSEKSAMGWFLDGRVSAVVGTHTHVQTADERILPGGTAYITDVGMAGPINSVIGMDRKAILKKYISRLPVSFNVAKGPVRVDAVLIDVEDDTGRSTRIERLGISCESSMEDLKEDGNIQ